MKATNPKTFKTAKWFKGFFAVGQGWFHNLDRRAGQGRAGQGAGGRGLVFTPQLLAGAAKRIMVTVLLKAEAPNIGALIK